MQLGEYIGAGDECEVYAYGKGRVIKVYTITKRPRRDRDFAFWMQRRLHKLGLAPRVYRRLKYGEHYAYISARADSIRGYSEEQSEAWHRAAEVLKAKLKKLGIWDKDTAPRNTSWKGKKLILIDCGPLTTERVR